MSEDSNVDTFRFSLSCVRTESRLLIHSTCRQCGASRLVSMHDGTLDQWHKEHVCGQSPVDETMSPRVSS